MSLWHIYGQNSIEWYTVEMQTLHLSIWLHYSNWVGKTTVVAVFSGTRSVILCCWDEQCSDVLTQHICHFHVSPTTPRKDKINKSMNVPTRQIFLHVRAESALFLFQVNQNTFLKYHAATPQQDMCSPSVSTLQGFVGLCYLTASETTLHGHVTYSSSIHSY